MTIQNPSTGTQSADYEIELYTDANLNGNTRTLFEKTDIGGITYATDYILSVEWWKPSYKRRFV